MKFNFRKIASVLASTVMLSSTVAMAAAANVPSPFVQNGKADVLVVYGSNPLAATTDMVAATDIQAYLNNKVNQQTGVTSTTTASTATGGDFVELNDGDDKMNLGRALNAVYTSLTNEELSTILADGTYENSDGDEYEYTQEISLGAPTLSLFADDEVDADEKPVIGFDIASGTNIMNYTLEFRTNPLNTTMDDTYIDMLGKTYYVSSVTTAPVIELLDTANSVTVSAGDPTTVTVGDQSYEVTLVNVNGGHDDSSDDTVTLSINGKKIDATNVGNSRKIAEDTYVSILDAAEADFEGDQEYAEIAIGSGKIVLSNGDNIEMNDDSVDDVKSYISTEADGTISSITIEWMPEDEVYLVPGMDLVMPGLEVVKLSMAGFITSDPEEMSIENSGDDYLELRTVELKDGSVSIPILYTNTTIGGFAGTGKDASNQLETSSGNTVVLNDSQNTRFVATYISGDEKESYYFEVSSINDNADDENITKIKNLANSQVYEFIDNDDVKIGKIKLAVNETSATAKTARVTVTDTSGSTTGVYLNKLVTKAGLTMTLPVESTTVAPTTGNGVLNTTAQPALWTMNFTEANEDGDALAGTSFTVTLGHTSSDGPEVKGTSLDEIATESGSDDKVAYVSGVDSHATKVTWKTGGDNDVLDIAYHEDEAYAQVYVSELATSITGGGDGNQTQTGVLLVEDTKVTSSTNNNLVVVGGSCVNKVAAELLGLTYGADSSCGQAWSSKTSVGAGSYLIQSFARNGKIATLVAGYNAPDTTNAAKAFKTLTVDTTAGKKYTGTTGETITPVVTTA